jgi:iron(III) transport system ATP-binding protein
MTALTVDAVSKQLGGALVLDEVSLSVPSGTRTALVGESGSGKTTLLRLIAGFDTPDGGTIALNDSVISGPQVFVPAHRRGIGYVPQDGALFPHLTVRQNIRFGLRRGAQRDQRVTDVCELVDLPIDLLNRYPHELSGGQQQRVAVARALAPAPDVLVLDEPFSALDTNLREHARMAVIAALDATGATSILVTHDQDEALMFGQQVGILESGRLLQHGPPTTVFDNPISPRVAEFLGEARFLQTTVDGTIAHTAFGPVSIRHSHATGDGMARLMLRPEQLRLHADPPHNAEVVSVLSRGVRTVITVESTGPGVRDRVDIDMPPDTTYAINDTVAIAVTGTAVAY